MKTILPPPVDSVRREGLRWLPIFGAAALTATLAVGYFVLREDPAASSSTPTTQKSMPKKFRDPDPYPTARTTGDLEITLKGITVEDVTVTNRDGSRGNEYWSITPDLGLRSVSGEATWVIDEVNVLGPHGLIERAARLPELPLNSGPWTLQVLAVKELGVNYRPEEILVSDLLPVPGPGATSELAIPVRNAAMTATLNRITGLNQQGDVTLSYTGFPAKGGTRISAQVEDEDGRQFRAFTTKVDGNVEIRFPPPPEGKRIRSTLVLQPQIESIFFVAPQGAVPKQRPSPSK